MERQGDRLLAGRLRRRGSVRRRRVRSRCCRPCGKSARRSVTVVYCGEADAPAGTVSFDELATRSEPIPDALRGGDALAGIFYTGGTTGFPKGVMLSHRNLLVAAFGVDRPRAPSRSGGQVLHAAPMFHLAGPVAWLSTSLTGGTHVIVPAFEPAAVLSAIVKHQVTDMLLVPTMIQMLVDHPELDQYDLSSLEQLVYGASPISPALLERSRRSASRHEVHAGLRHDRAAAGHHAAQRRRPRRPDPDPQCRPGRTARRGPDRRRRRRRGAPRHRRRDRRPRRARHARLLEQARGDRGRAARRLDAHRRRRPTWTTTATSSSSTGSRT